MISFGYAGDVTWCRVEKQIFQASFLRNVASNLIDKIGTCIIGYLLIKAMPMRFLDNFKKEA